MNADNSPQQFISIKIPKKPDRVWTVRQTSDFDLNVSIYEVSFTCIQ
jgi:hypothetical protein